MSSESNLNKKEADLNKKQAIFVREYLVDFNGTKAAVAAGYSKKTAEAAASRLLRNVKVRSAIDAQTAERCEKLGIQADSILGELSKLAFANMLDYITINGEGDAFVDFSALTRDQAAAMQEVTSETYTEETGEIDKETGGRKKRVVKRTKFKLASKKDSLELLGRHLKLFTDKVDLNANLNGSLKLDPSERLARLTALLTRATEGGARAAQ